MPKFGWVFANDIFKTIFSIKTSEKSSTKSNKPTFHRSGKYGSNPQGTGNIQINSKNFNLLIYNSESKSIVTILMKLQNKN